MTTQGSLIFSTMTSRIHWTRSPTRFSSTKWVLFESCRVAEYMKHWLSGRWQRIVIIRKSFPSVLVKSGFSQWSFLIPLLFLIYINDLDTFIIRKNLKVCRGQQGSRAANQPRSSRDPATGSRMNQGLIGGIANAVLTPINAQSCTSVELTCLQIYRVCDPQPWKKMGSV